LLGVLTASAPDQFYRESACRDATRSIVAEATAIAVAMGCRVSGDAEGQIRNGGKSGHRTSILQDLELGRPMEIDALYTATLQMAREAGVATPMLDLLVAMTRVRARSAGLYAA
jgi:2-dehydropantoate 2-reductase